MMIGFIKDEVASKKACRHKRALEAGDSGRFISNFPRPSAMTGGTGRPGVRPNAKLRDLTKNVRGRLQSVGSLDEQRNQGEK